MPNFDNPNSHNVAVRDVSYEHQIRRATNAEEWDKVITLITAHPLYQFDARPKVVECFLKHCPEADIKQRFTERALLGSYGYLDSMIARNQPFIARETLDMMWRAAQALGEEAVSRLVSYIGDHELIAQLPLKYRGAFELARARSATCC
jgi:hypothetical protein